VRSSKGVMGREPRSRGEKLCAWVLGMLWRMEGRGSGEKPEQQRGGLGLRSSLRGQSWCPDKGSVHGPTWPQPRCAVTL
jgi:hypothetical protein